MSNVKRHIHFMIVISLILMISLAGCNKSDTKTTESNPKDVTTEEKTEIKEEGLQFPYVIEDAGVTVNSFFTSTIPNPDCDGEMGEDVASLEIQNTSDRYIKEANITVYLLNGEQIKFKATDIPAGKTADLFSVNNISIKDDYSCKVILCETSFSDDTSLLEDKIEISVENMNVTLKNLTDEDINDLTIYCHTSMDGVIFGGTTYKYKVDNIPAYDKTVVVAEDCYIDSAEVVRIKK